MSNPADRNTLKKRLLLGVLLLLALVAASPASASEAELVTPDLSTQTFFGGIDGHTLLVGGIFVCLLGMAFGLVVYVQLKNLPVHRSMREISELIYETCKTYLVTQGKFILILEAFIGAVIVFYFGWLRDFEVAKVVDHPAVQPGRHRRQLRRRLVRHPGQHLRQLAHRPSPACAASRSRPTPFRSRPACRSACC